MFEISQFDIGGYEFKKTRFYSFQSILVGILSTFRTKYYYQIIELSSQIETLNIELKTA